MQANKTIEEKYQEKVKEACRWLNNLLCKDANTGNIRVLPLDYKSKKEINAINLNILQWLELIKLILNLGSNMQN